MNELKPEDVMRAKDSCANCLHYDICKVWAKGLGVEKMFPHEVESAPCEQFQPKALLREKDTKIEWLTRVVKQRNEQLSDLVKIILQKSGRHPLLRKRTMMIEIIRNDAITEFAERLKSKCDAPNWCVWLSEIEDLEKEMKGATDG